jgi:hypothetical protein
MLKIKNIILSFDLCTLSHSLLQYLHTVQSLNTSHSYMYFNENSIKGVAGMPGFVTE